MKKKRSVEAVLDEYDLSQVFDDLFPICRSITGPGLERSFEVFSEYMPLQIEKVPSGTKVFDWVVPPEWHFKRAVLKGPDGKTIIDSGDSNLHVVNYSGPVDRKMTLDEIQKHLHSLPHLPDAIPYVTQYYKAGWGLCLSESQRSRLVPGEYHVMIESAFRDDGGVPFATCVLPGDSEKEVVLSSYLCHPSLANNELSGPLTLLAAYDEISRWRHRKYTYRFVLNPETIGSLCFLSRYHRHLEVHMLGGLVLTCTGGPKDIMSYKLSRRGNSLFDQVARYINQTSDRCLELRDFSATGGSDERQYCSPGFNLPMGQLARTVYGNFKEYHTSLDTKEFMGIGQVKKSARFVIDFLKLVEDAEFFENTQPFGEPHLGSRGLYPNMNSSVTRQFSSDSVVDGREMLNRILVVLNTQDGERSLYEAARVCGCTVEGLRPVVEKLSQAGLLVKRS